MAQDRGVLSSSQIKELEAAWASKKGPGKRLRSKEPPNSGCQHSAVTKRVAHASSGDRPQAKRQTPRRAGQHSAVTQCVAHAGSGDRPKAKRPCQEEHAHVPPHKCIRCKQPALSGSGQPSANSSRGSTVDGDIADGGSAVTKRVAHAS